MDHLDAVFAKLLSDIDVAALKLRSRIRGSVDPSLDPCRLLERMDALRHKMEQLRESAAQVAALKVSLVTSCADALVATQTELSSMMQLAASRALTTAESEGRWTQLGAQDALFGLNRVVEQLGAP